MWGLRVPYHLNPVPFLIWKEIIVKDLKDKILTQINFEKFYTEHLGKLTTTNGNEALVRCPFHDDKTPSLSINLDTGFYHCFGCGEKGDIFTFYQKINGLNFTVALHRLADELGIKTHNGLGELEKVYDYTDANGTVVFQVCRFEGKQIRLRQPDSNGGYIWNIKGVAPIPYNLPAVTKAHTIYICEGEKDCDTLNALGYTTATNSNGAGKWNSILNKFFKDKEVVILPDNDEPGRKHAELVAHSLAGHASSIKVVEFSDLPEKADVTDFLNSLSTQSIIRKRFCLDSRIACTYFWEPQAEIEPIIEAEGFSLSSISATELMLTDFPPVSEVIGQGILPEGCGLMLAGEAKTGKSLLSLEWAIHLALGRSLFDGLIPVPKARKVLFFQVENPERQIKFRLSRMMEGLGLTETPENIFFADRNFRYNLLNAKFLAEMIHLINECGAEVFIIDPLSSFHSVDENNNVLMRNVLDQITFISTTTGASSIVVHHFGKQRIDQQEKDRTRGASSIQGWYDTHCMLVNKQHEEKTLRVVKFGPLRHGAEIKPILIERDDNFISHVTEVDSMITPQDVENVINDNFGGRVESAYKLQTALIDEFDCSRITTIRAIKEAEKFGRIRAINGVGKTKIYEVVKS